MRKLTRKQIIARLIIGFIVAGSMLYSVNAALATDYGIYTINGETKTLTDIGINPPNNSNNIIGVNITSVGTGNIGCIYGGYNEATDNVSSNSVTINRSNDSNVTIDSVVGGSAYDGSSTYNVVNITNIATSEVEGGFSENGDVTNNTVIVTDSSLDNGIIGGLTFNGSASCNLVEATNVSSQGINGGFTLGGNASGNTVIASGANIVNGSSPYSGVIAGGYIDGDGDANGNKVTVTNSSSERCINAAYIKGNGNASNNELTVKDSETSEVYGVSIDGNGNGENNEVSITNVQAVDAVAVDIEGNGNARNNKNSIVDSNIENNGFSAFVFGEGDLENNELTVSNSYVEYIAGATNAYINDINYSKGDVVGNKTYVINSESDTAGAAMTNIGNAKNNELTVIGSVISSAAGAGSVVDKGKAENNKTTIIDSTIGIAVGGLTGYLSGGGAANNNEISISSSTIYMVVGGLASYMDSEEGSANGNKVTVSSSTVEIDVIGGFTGNSGGIGDAKNNEVTVSDSIVNENIVGGLVKAGGDASNNIVNITNTTANSSMMAAAIFGNGNAETNELTITDSEADSCYAAVIFGDGDANNNEMTITNSTIDFGAGASCILQDGTAEKNKTTIINSTISQIAIGAATGFNSGGGDALANELYISSSTASIAAGGVAGYSLSSGPTGYGNTNNNKVTVSSSTVDLVVGGFAVDGESCGNEVTVSGSSVKYNEYCFLGESGSVYGGLSLSGGNTVNNTVTIKNGSKIDIAVIGGSSSDYTGNKLIVGGKDNSTGEIRNFETLDFDATEVKDGDTMLALTSDTAFHIGASGIDILSPNLSTGEKITLVSSKADNTYEDNIDYRIDGKKPYKDGLFDVVQEDSDKVVHINEYEITKEDNDLNLCGKGSFVSAVYSGKDDEGNPVNLGNSEMIISSVPEKTGRIYGAFSNDADTKAGGAKISVTASGLDLSDKDIIGSYNAANAANIDTSNNVIKFEAGGIKIGSVEGFDSIVFKPAFDETPTLAVNRIQLDNAKVNTEISSGFNGTKTLLTSDTSFGSASSYAINGEIVSTGQKYHVAKANTSNVTIGTYQYDTSSDKALSLTGDALIAGVYRKGESTLAAKDNALVVDKTIAGNYSDVYGAYSADNSDATGATVKIAEKINDENLNIHGGKSLGGGKVSGNTLEVAASAAGSKVKNVDGFDKVKFTMDSNQSADNPVIQVNSINLDNAKVNTEIDSGFNGTRTLIKATESISKNSTEFAINDTVLTGNQKYYTVNTNLTNVNIGTYQYRALTDKEIAITGNSLITGTYKNGSQKMAAADNTLVVDKTIASNYDTVYGAFSADGSDAINATVQISEKLEAENLTISGGYSANAGADTKTGNTLKIDKAGNKVKAITNFSKIGFSMKNMSANNFVMLTTVDKTDLNGITVDADMAGKSLKKGEKVVFLDNVENKAAKLLIDGEEGNRRIVDEKETYVALNTVGYTDDIDKVAIENKESIAAGMYIDENDKSYGKNTLTIGVSAGNARVAVAGPELAELDHVYAAYSTGSKAPTGATIEIISPIDYSNTVIHGGYSTASGFVATGNTLSVKTMNAKVKGITHFENMDFVLPPEIANGTTMLNVIEAVDMEPTKKINVYAEQSVNLKDGDSVNLINSETGIYNFGKQDITISGLTDKIGEVAVADKALTLSIEEEKQNQNTKAPVESIAAVMSDISAANDLIYNGLSNNMLAVINSGEAESFAALNGRHSKSNTGSYIESDAWNLGFGVGKKGLSMNNPDATFGLFVQYGKSDFSTHNDNFRGDGDNELIGGGLMFHQDGRSGYYYDGNVVAGKVDTKWNCSAGGYDDSAPYYGFTFGMGTKTNHGNNRVTDVYGRYSFNHLGSMEGNIGGYDYDFDTAISSNLRLGVRVEYLKGSKNRAYWGLAWEHEFAGDFDATMNLGPTESPSIKGDTGIAEIGYEWTRGDWNYNLNLEGSFGKREGITGSTNIIYNF